MDQLFSAETQAEHRRFPRISLKLKVHYKCLNQGDVSLAIDSIAEDLGAGGMAMRTRQRLPEDQLLMLSLFLPPENRRGAENSELLVPENECTPVAVLSRVVWCLEKAGEGFWVGVQFLDLNLNHRKLLKSFLVDFNLDEPDSLLYQT